MPTPQNDVIDMDLVNIKTTNYDEEADEYDAEYVCFLFFCNDIILVYRFLTFDSISPRLKNKFLLLIFAYLFFSFDRTLPFATPIHHHPFDPNFAYLPKYPLSPQGSPVMSPYGMYAPWPRQFMAQTDEDWNPVPLGIFLSCSFHRNISYYFFIFFLSFSYY